MDTEQFASWSASGWQLFTWDICFWGKHGPTDIAGAPTQTCAWDILSFRVRQAVCLDIPDCTEPSSNQYENCVNVDQPSCKEHCHIDCAASFWSLPWLLREDLTEIACVTTGNTQPGEKTGQLNSAFCYGKFDSALGIPNPPFTPGTACSACPEGTLCYENLCREPWPTGSPTVHPTSKSPTTRAPTPQPTSKSPTTRSPVSPTAPTKKPSKKRE